MSDPGVRSDLIEADPFFQFPQIKIFQTRNVLHECDANSFEPSFLVLATHGIFLYKESKSNHYKLIQSITHLELISILIAGETASFSSETAQIKVKSADIASFALLVYYIREAQFSSSCLPLTIHFPREYESQLHTPSPYSDNVFFDRLLTCIYYLKIQITEHELNKLYEEMEFEETETFVFSSTEIYGHFLKAIFLALAYEMNLKEIHIKNTKMKDFFENCRALFTFNKFIKRIIINNCDFSDFQESLKQLLKAKHLFSPNEWTFINNDCSQDAFVEFFKFIPQILNEDMKTLVFNSCNFSSQTMDSITQELLFNDCFHSLYSISFSHIHPGYSLNDLASTLLTSDQASKNEHKLNILELSDCEIDSSTNLINIFQFNTGLRAIRFRNSFAERLIDLKPTIHTKQLVFLDFRNSRFSSQNLISLFDLSCNSLVYLRGLDLSNITVFPPILADVLEAISTKSLPCLETLFFDGNRLKANELKYFSQFISLQKNLKFLSVNCSISALEDSLSVSSFLDKVAQLEHLEQFSIRSDGSVEFTLGPILTPFLTKLLNQHLTLLDITNQGVTGNGIHVLQQLLSKKELKYFYFDGVLFDKQQHLIDFCSSILSQKIEHSSWPINSFNRFNNQLSLIQYDNNIDEEYKNNIKIQFAFTFGKKSLEIQDDDQIAYERSQRIIEDTKDDYVDPKIKVFQESYLKPIPDIKLYGVEYISSIDPSIKDVYMECVGDDEIDQPLVRLLAINANKFSTKEILKQLKSSFN